jgi:cyanophycinase
MTGVLALVGGGEFTPVCAELDRELLGLSGVDEVLVLPTAAAYEMPERVVVNASNHFEPLGARVRGLMVLARPDALEQEVAAIVRASRFIYLAGGSPMHVRSVLKDTPVWEAIVAAWHDGAVVAGASAGAMVLSDPMVDPRGGAFTLGLALVAPLAVVPHHEDWSHDRTRRTYELAPKGVPVVALDTGAAAVRSEDATWSARGNVQVMVDGREATLTALP